MRTLNVALGDRAYPIHIGRGLLDRPDLILPHLRTRRVAVVTNDVVGPLYLDRLRANRQQIELLDRKLEAQALRPATNQGLATATVQAPATGATNRVEDRDKVAAARNSLFWGTVWILFAFEFLRMFYMISWEFFFRGFMLQGMLRLGLGWHAVWIQMLPYVMLHSTKPSIELYYTIPSGLLLGVLAWKAGSIWPGFLLHFVGAVLFDVFAMFA